MDSPEQPGSGSPSPLAINPTAARVAPNIPGHVVYQRIGAGSYGEVWLAQNALGEWRAVKIVRRDKFDEDRPYEREFEGLSHYAPISLSHPSLLRVLQVESPRVHRTAWTLVIVAEPGALSLRLVMRRAGKGLVRL